AVSFKKDLSTSFVAILRDSTSGSIKGLSRHYHFLLEPKLAEAFAIIKALCWLKTLGMDCIIVDSDCLQVILALNNNDKDIFDFGMLILDC
ncbi:hypothetical protein Goari_021339, partial [Gossypium aridum]|nr:hypothetical protein [Gossypium aridum]